MSFLSLTEQDREQMLETIGVDSIEELFEQIPAGVRLGRPRALAPARSGPQRVARSSSNGRFRSPSWSPT
jgi:glycine cleavage system pyridoxal-binding protein P